MKLRRRQTRKDHALDAVASVTKTWSEWQLAKRAGKGIAKAKDVRPSKIKSALSSKRVRLAGAIAVLGGAGAFVARKLKGDDATTYTGPAPSEAVEAAKSAPEAETPPPLTMAPDPATEPSADKAPAVPDSALRYKSSQPAAADMPEAAASAPPEPDFSALSDPAPEPELAPEPEPVPEAAAAADTSDNGAGDAAAGEDEPAAGATAGPEAGGSSDDDV